MDHELELVLLLLMMIELLGNITIDDGVALRCMHVCMISAEEEEEHDDASDTDAVGDSNADEDAGNVT